MIGFLHTENFKSLRSISIPTEKLNLFFGMNDTGKSSVIQAMLMLRQSYWKNNHHDLNCLHVNGDLIELGTMKDILCETAEVDRVRFVMSFTGDRCWISVTLMQSVSQG